MIDGGQQEDLERQIEECEAMMARLEPAHRQRDFQASLLYHDCRNQRERLYAELALSETRQGDD